MQTTIRRVRSIRSDLPLILLFSDKEQIRWNLFSKVETSHIRAELKRESKTIVINQYNRLVFLQKTETGEKTEAKNLEKARKSGAALFGRCQQAAVKEIGLCGEIQPELALAFAEGFVLTGYQFLKYRSKRDKETHGIKAVLTDVKGVSERAVEELNTLNTAVFKARDLVNEPQNFLTATELGKQFSSMAKEAGFRIHVLNKTRIRQLKMGGLLAVNQGSPEPPTFSIMEWKPRNAVNKKPYVLVGKGVVYDTGGMSLKPTPNSMDYMKCDMAGSATVAATLFAVAKSKLPIHVVGLVPATDNRPDGNAYVPGDVITMMSGKTVEVLNTDAEGRLILADALHYAKRYNPELVLEFSTLTGAAAAAIGAQGIVCMGEVDEPTRKALHEAGHAVHERLAELPFWEEYDELIKSDIADLKNIGGPIAGAITAGRFLQQFAEFPYMHFDIAAPAFRQSNDGYRLKNGTGVGVRLMYTYLKGLIG